MCIRDRGGGGGGGGGGGETGGGLTIVPPPPPPPAQAVKMKLLKPATNKKSARIRIEILPYSKIIHMIFLNKMLIGIRIFII